MFKISQESQFNKSAMDSIVQQVLGQRVKAPELGASPAELAQFGEATAKWFKASVTPVITRSVQASAQRQAAVVLDSPEDIVAQLLHTPLALAQSCLGTLEGLALQGDFKLQVSTVAAPLMREIRQLEQAVADAEAVPQIVALTDVICNRLDQLEDIVDDMSDVELDCASAELLEAGLAEAKQALQAIPQKIRAMNQNLDCYGLQHDLLHCGREVIEELSDFGLRLAAEGYDDCELETDEITFDADELDLGETLSVLEAQMQMLVDFAADGPVSEGLVAVQAERTSDLAVAAKAHSFCFVAEKPERKELKREFRGLLRRVKRLVDNVQPAAAAPAQPPKPAGPVKQSASASTAVAHPPSQHSGPVASAPPAADADDIPTDEPDTTSP